jgi:small subunit ribosomal protein S3
MHEGRVPLHTIRADIDYGFTEAHTIMGRIGIKVWIYKGDILPELKTVEAEVAAEAAPQPVAAAPTGASPVIETPAVPAAESSVKIEKAPVTSPAPSPSVTSTTSSTKEA